MFGCKQMGLCRIINCSSIQRSSKRIQTTSCRYSLGPKQSWRSKDPRRVDDSGFRSIRLTLFQRNGEREHLARSFRHPAEMWSLTTPAAAFARRLRRARGCRPMQPGRSRSPSLPVSGCAKVVRRIDTREAGLYYAQDDKKERAGLDGTKKPSDPPVSF